MCTSTMRGTSATRDTILPLKTARFVYQEEQPEQHHHTANLGQPQPNIRLSFPTRVIVLGEGIIILYSTQLVCSLSRYDYRLFLYILGGRINWGEFCASLARILILTVLAGTWRYVVRRQIRNVRSHPLNIPF